MKRTTLIAMLALLLGVIGSLEAQTQTPVINKRQRHQQARIKEGVKSGELTPGETNRLEKREGKLEADKLNAKADGKVTPAERRKLRREENRDSKKIYRAKHNGAVRKDG